MELDLVLELEVVLELDVGQQQRLFLAAMLGTLRPSLLVSN